MRQMRSEYFEKEKAARRQRGLLKLSALLRGSGAHSPCNVHLNYDEAGIANYSRFSEGLADFGNYFSRVGDCENQGGIDPLIMDFRQLKPTQCGGVGLAGNVHKESF